MAEAGAGGETSRRSGRLEEAISNAKDTGARETVNAANGEEIYAYPIPGSRIAWGVNDETGWNILRGIRRPDGTDEAEG
jgi:hypothetical protein